jgi:hypothetical protein
LSWLRSHKLGGERKHFLTGKVVFRPSILKYLLHYMTGELAILRVGETFLHPLCPSLDDRPCCADVGFEPFIMCAATARALVLYVSAVEELRMHQKLDTHSIWYPRSLIFQVWFVFALRLPVLETIRNVYGDTNLDVETVRVFIGATRKDIHVTWLPFVRA